MVLVLGGPAAILGVPWSIRGRPTSCARFRRPQSAFINHRVVARARERFSSAGVFTAASTMVGNHEHAHVRGSTRHASWFFDGEEQAKPAHRHRVPHEPATTFIRRLQPVLQDPVT